MEVLNRLKVTDTSGWLLDIITTASDRYLQACIKETEYLRSDAPKNLKYVGALPPGRQEKAELPSWWDVIVKHKKPLVIVSQGTVANNPDELILPALEAMKDLDVQVVAILVRSNDIAGYQPPPNALMTKSIPFDDLFPHANLVMSNGGYGTIQHAFSAGVPIVLAGMSEDKSEGTARAAWTGAAINLAIQLPTGTQIREAVETVLTTSTYSARAQELKMKYLESDPLGDIAMSIDELASTATNEPKRWLPML